MAQTSVYFGPPCRGVQGGPDPPGSEIQISDPPGRTPLDPEGESSKSWIFVQICSKNNTNFDCRSTEYKIFRLRRADSDFSILNLSKSLIFKNQGGLGPPWIWDWNLGPPWPDPPGFEASRNTGLNMIFFRVCSTWNEPLVRLRIIKSLDRGRIE